MASEQVIDTRFKSFNPKYTHTFEWIFENFLNIKKKKVLSSPKFRTKDDTTWNVSYEKVNISGNEQSLLCFYNTSASEMTVDISVEFRDLNGLILYSPTVSKYDMDNTIAFSFNHKQYTGGSRVDLNLTLDTLLLICHMSWIKETIVTESYNPGTLTSVPNSCLNTLSEDLKNIYESSIGADVTLAVQGTNILAHKSILQARSEVFAKMLLNDMKEKASGIIEIEDMEPHIAKSLLQYLYTGVISDCDIETAQALYQAADKYALPKLKKVILGMLLPKISTENAVSLLNLADLHDDIFLKNEVTLFIKYHLCTIPNIEDAWKLFDDALSNEKCTELMKNICFKNDTS